MKIILYLIILFPFLLNGQNIELKCSKLCDAYNKDRNFNGYILIGKGNKIIFSKGYGFSNEKERQKNSIRTQFRIASLTKQFTALIILRLEHAALLSVNDPISKFIKDFPNGDSINIHCLLSNTSGIKDFSQLPEFKIWNSISSTLENSINHFKNLPLNFKPGTKFQYSNSNYILLSYIAEKVTHKSFSKLLSELVQSAGMNNSGMDFNKRTSAKKALGYDLDENERTQLASYNDMSIPSGAGGMFSTAQDLQKWDLLLLGSKFLDKAIKSKLFTPNRGNYGYGWEINSVDNHKMYSHSGSIEGFLSYNAILPNDSFYIVILTNHIRSEMQLQSLQNALISLILGKPYELPYSRKIINVKIDTLKSYVGEYQMGKGFIIKISLVNGQLYLQVRDDKPLHLFAESDSVFFMKDIGSKITFVRNRSEKYDGLLLEDGGEVMNLKKIK